MSSCGSPRRVFQGFSPLTPCTRLQHRAVRAPRRPKRALRADILTKNPQALWGIHSTRFHLLPDRFEPLELRRRARRMPLLAQLLLQLVEALLEAAERRPERILRRNPQMPGEVGHGEEDVAQLAEDGLTIAFGDGAVEFGELLVDLGARPLGIRPVEADPRGLFPGPLRAQEGGSLARDPVQDGARPTLLLRSLLGLEP